MDSQAVRIKSDLYAKLREYEQISGVPIGRSVDEAVRNFVKCTLPPRIEFHRAHASQGAPSLVPKPAKKMRAKYQSDTQAAAG